MVTGGATKLRDVAHRISDKIYENLTGVRGLSTRVLYVTANRMGDGKDRFQLQLADADGYRAQTILESTTNYTVARLVAGRKKNRPIFVSRSHVDPQSISRPCYGAARKDTVFSWNE